MKNLRPLNVAIVFLCLTPYRGQTISKDTYFEEDLSKLNKRCDNALFNVTCSTLATCLVKCIHTHPCTAVCYSDTDGSCSGQAVPAATEIAPGHRLWKVKGEEPCEDGKFYANPENIHTYFRCASGNLKQRECPAGLVFKVAILTCTFP